MWPLTTIYMHNYLHQTLTMAGIVLFCSSMSMIGGNYLGGYIYDNKDAYKALLVSLGVSLLALGILIFKNGWPYYPILIVINSFAIGVSGTITNSLATAIEKYDSRYVFNLLYFMANLGVVIGTLSVGFIVEISIRLIFVINFVMFALFMLIAAVFFVVPEHVKKKKMQVSQTGDKTSRRFVIVIMAILITYLMISLGYSQWQSNLSVYMESLKIPLARYSLLWTINGVIIVCLQPFISWLDEHYKINIFNKLYFGIGIFIVAFGSLIFAHTYIMFILSMVLATVGEVCVFPTIPAIVDRFSSLSEKGKYQGRLAIASSLGHAVGPLFGGIIIELFSYNILFLLMVLGVLLGEVALIICTKINLKAGERHGNHTR